MKQYKGLYINGKWISSTENELKIVNPANEEIIGLVAPATVDHVDLAVNAAKNALFSWKSMPSEKRANILRSIATQIQLHKLELAEIESRNTGKPIKDALGDMDDCSQCFEYFSGWVSKLSGRFVQMEPDVLSSTTRIEPIGVCGLIIPWNYPLLMAAWKMAPALACANTIVIKPSELTPLSLLRFCELLDTTGIPPGVVNVITGDGSIVGRSICVHPQIDKIGFTGSTAVGHQVLRCAADSNLKRTTLELGGKSPMIVFADANLAKAVNDVCDAAFSNSGQNCCAGTKLFIEKPILNLFLQALKERISNIVVGDPTNEKVSMGPVTSFAQFEKVMFYIKLAQQHQYHCLTGGSRIGCKGYLIEPTVFTNVPDDSQLANEEIFGPVLCVLAPFENIDDVIERANSGPYGLAAGIWTSNIAVAEKMAGTLNVGTVWINCYNKTSMALPFGGFKQSGYGKDLGEEALCEYSRTKVVTYCYK